MSYLLPAVRRFVAGAIFTAAVLSVDSQACGPFFPNQVLLNPADALKWAPVADLKRELDRIPLGEGPNCKAVPWSEEEGDHKDAFHQSERLDLAELKQVLAETHLSPAQQAEILSPYASRRAALTADFESVQQQGPRAAAARSLRLSQPNLSEQTPPEFAQYLLGLSAYRQGDSATARTLWTGLLRLPAYARKHRSVWAAFMLGKLELKHDPSVSIPWFEQARALAREGFTDVLGLAAASLGWEAQARWSMGDRAGAFKLYLQQNAAGDDSARTSIVMICERLFADEQDQNLSVVARDHLSSMAITAYLVARGGPYRNDAGSDVRTRWLSAVEAANAGDIIGADRLAWVAYQGGDFDSAQRWLARADPSSPIGLWLNAKLLCRAGRLDEATAVLAKAVHALPANAEWREVGGGYFDYGSHGHNPRSGMFPAARAAAELGVLKLTRGNYVESLDLLLRSGWWFDAAYVAERVLTVDELKQYVDQNWPKAAALPVDQPEEPDRAERPPNSENAIRHLLARRLTRVGRWKDARAYLPSSLQPRLDAYVNAIREGHDRNHSPDVRAKALWTAALIARREGMELMGTELSPDQFSSNGNYDYPEVAEWRADPRFDQGLEVAADEVKRAAASAPDPDKRFHYRYVAAEHAWAAAQLMPDESDETAKILSEAGQWLAARDPGAAERFYQALVARCGSTSLGQAARKRKWFPAETH